MAKFEDYGRKDASNSVGYQKPEAKTPKLHETDIGQEMLNKIKAKKAKTSSSRKKATESELEFNNWLAGVIDNEMGEGYIYSSSELHTQQAEAWRRYYRAAYNNEVPGFSTWVSPMITKHVNDIRAFITEQYFGTSSHTPIVKFIPKSGDDIESAEMANEYVNHVFRNKLDGHAIIDQTVFNAALLKMCPVRVYLKETKTEEDVVFKYDGTSEEEAQQRYAEFLVANPEIANEEPFEDIKKVYERGNKEYTYICAKWKKINVAERYPDVEVIPPENFFVSRQAESLEKALLVACMQRVKIGDLKVMYPDAPMINGYSAKNADEFWEQLTGDYNDWYQDTTWFAKWEHDTLGYYEQYDEISDDLAGLGAKQIFVVDAEMYVDPEDSGVHNLCHVVKAGPWILYKKEISERSFICGSLWPTANRWLGLGVWDLLEQDAREETTNVRAFTDATVQAAHSNPIVDPDQIETKDVENMSPSSIIRRKRGSLQKAGVPAIEWTKQPGPDPSVLQAVQNFQQSATNLTGAGAGFAGVNKDDVSGMRIAAESVKTISNKSDLLMNYFARNYANFIAEVQLKILNMAVKGGATPELLHIKNRWHEVSPIGMIPRSQFILGVSVGVNEKEDKLTKATLLLDTIVKATTAGVQLPFTPNAPYEISKKLLNSLDVKEIDKVLVNPDDQATIAQDPQVQAYLAEMSAQMQAQSGQMIEQAVQEALGGVQSQLTMAQAEEIKSRAALNLRKAQNLDHTEEKDAFNSALAESKADRDDEKSATEIAVDLKNLELQEFEIKEEIKLKKRQLDEKPGSSVGAIGA